jgi:hypothetical protein
LTAIRVWIPSRCQMFDRAPAPLLLAPVVIFPVPAPRARVGWGRCPDGDEIIYLYDANEGNFGYALNLTCDWCSEWGYAPSGDPDAED